MDNTPLISSHDHHEEEKQVDVVKEFGYESKRLSKLAGPAIFTYVCQYSLGVVTQMFAGLVGKLELAAVSVAIAVVTGLAFGLMLGMGSALETLCGQAYGAGRLRMLGLYMQRSWVILMTTACLLVPIYVWSPPMLELFGETIEISRAAGVILVLHVFFSWLLILRLGWGLIGAAVTLNTSRWLIVIESLLYIFITKSDGAWCGFSWLAFADLFGFVKLSLASAVMLCLDVWYLMGLVILVGRLPNPLISVDAISICMNISVSAGMIAIGLNAAISVRVSNELGGGNAKAAKFSVLVVSIVSVAMGFVCMIVVFATRDHFPYLFTNSDAVAEETTKLAILLGITVLLNSLQPVLCVAVGAGWQSLVAYINIGCYYIVGLPAGILMGFTFGFGAMAEEAESRVRKWEGSAGEY